MHTFHRRASEYIYSREHVAAAAAAKLLQSCPTLCNPTDDSPPGSSIPGILQARALEWVAISFSSAWKWKVKMKSLSHVWLLATPWTATYQAPPSMQEYWSGVPLPSQNIVLHQEIRKTLNRQPNFKPKTTGKRKTKNPKISRKKQVLKIQAEISEKDMKETIAKINKNKAGSLRR